MKKILLIESYFTGSHKKWALDLKQNSRFEIQILEMPGRNWKWRMFGSAVHLSERFLESSFQPNLILCSDMTDLCAFLGLTRRKSAYIPTCFYFHENQISYPWSPRDRDIIHQRNDQYGIININSALAADQVVFNSDFHRESFKKASLALIKRFPDFRYHDQLSDQLEQSSVLPVGVDFSSMDSAVPKSRSELGIKDNVPVFLWNHRWEHDKNPKSFFGILKQLKDKKIEFKLIVLGERSSHTDLFFADQKRLFSNEIIHWGHAESRQDYYELLKLADISLVTSIHDFFGISVIESIYCGAFPLLPNRLAYPEHIPSTLAGSIFYSSEHEAVHRLEKLIEDRSYKESRILKHLKQHLKRYEMGEVIRQYDELFDQLIEPVNQ
jgi:glycosyltransferase involved in cell wall biosynthesis